MKIFQIVLIMLLRTVEVQLLYRFFFSQRFGGEVKRIVYGLRSKFCVILTYPLKALKLIFDKASPVTPIIINGLFLCSEIWPSRFKVAKVVLEHKGNLKTDIKNCKPISLLTLLSKIFGTTVHNQVHKVIEKYYLFIKNPFGSEEEKITFLVIMDDFEYIYKKLDFGIQVISYFLEFREALNCTNHEILL